MPRHEPDLTEFEELTDATELQRQNDNLKLRLRRYQREHEALVDAVREGTRDAFKLLGPMPAVKAPAPDRRGKPEAALWHLTDWQAGKLTPSYNSKVMNDRIHTYLEKAERLTQIQRADHPVDTGVVLFGGDSMEGLFNFPSQPFEVDQTLFGQFAAAAKLEAEVVRKALSLYKEVLVVQEWGNHGRLGSKRSAIPPSDNADRMIHELAREMVGEDKRLTWEDSEEDIQRVQVGAYRALLIHGDEVGRTGFASPTTMIRKCADWKSGAYPWRFRDVYCGHYHNHSEWELPDGEGALFYTGSPESDNRYARVTMASSSVPSQRLHFLNTKKGRITAQYKVTL